MKREWVMVLDTDGVLTDGTFYNDIRGKCLKRFGPDDWDSLHELKKFAGIHIITGDKTGFPIVKTRVDRLGFPLDLAPNKPPKRWEFIKQLYPKKKIIYVGDGLYDWHPLRESDYGIAPADALPHVRANANHVPDRTGAHRFVASACLHVLSSFFNVDIGRIGEDLVYE